MQGQIWGWSSQNQLGCHMGLAVAYLLPARSSAWLHLAVLLFADEGETFSQGRAAVSWLLLPKNYECSSWRDCPS